MVIDEKVLMQMGIASLLPGFRVMREIIDQHENEYRSLLESLQQGSVSVALPRKNGVARLSKSLLKAIASPVLEDEHDGERPKSKRHISAKGRAAIAQAQRERWARQKAEKEAAAVVPVAVKKKAGKTRRGHKPKATHGWANMTPEERSAEMRRRLAVSRGEAPSQAKHKNASWYKKNRKAVTA